MVGVSSYLNKNLIVFQSFKIFLSHLDQVDICALVLSELELNMAPGVLQEKRVISVWQHDTGTSNTAMTYNSKQ